jgi:hypothetical protein
MTNLSLFLYRFTMFPESNQNILNVGIDCRGLRLKYSLDDRLPLGTKETPELGAYDYNIKICSRKCLSEPLVLPSVENPLVIT